MLRIFGLSNNLICTLLFVTSVASVLATAKTAFEFQQTAEAAAPSQPAAMPIEPGKTTEREISGKEEHNYQIALKAGQYAGVTVEQRGIDVVVQIKDADGKVIADVDSETRTAGEERVGLVADAPPGSRIVVKPRYSKAAAGHYAIRLAEVRAAIEKDRWLFEAHKLDANGRRLNDAGKYDEAIKQAEQSLALGEKALGPDDAYVGYLLTRLGLYERTKGDYAKAEQNLQRAITINEKALGKEDPQTAWSYQTLGLVYKARNEDAKAEQYLQQAIDLTEKTLGPEHPRLAIYLMGIAHLHQTHGDFQPATKELERALAITEKTLEPDDFMVMALTHNLGDLYLDQEDYDRAEPLIMRALQLAEQKYGPDHPNVAVPLQNLGAIAREKKEYARAIEYLERAHKIQEKSLGPRHPQTASLLLNIGNVYKQQGEYSKALEYYRQALNILQDSAGPYHDYTMMSLASIANTRAAQGDNVDAVEYQKRVDQVVEKKLELNLATGSERERLAYSDWMSHRTDRTISLHAFEFPHDRTARDLAAIAILRRKARVLDAMSGSFTALREHLQPEDQKLLDQLSTTNSELAKLALRGPGKTPPAEYNSQLSALGQQREKLEAEISHKSAGYYEPSSAVTLDAIRADIPSGAVLIEFATYRTFHPEMPEERYDDPKYIAYVIPQRGEIMWKDLGTSKEIDALIGALRPALFDPTRSDVRKLSRALDEKLMQPLRPLIGSAKQLLISPDGELNLIPFEALVDEYGHYLVQRYSITYLTTGRDLLRMTVARASKSRPVVIADPAFGEPQAVQIASLDKPDLNVATAPTQRRSITSAEDLSSVYFAPLAGTAQEAQTIKSLFPNANVLTGANASKAALKRADAPAILHIATHGFFLTGTSDKFAGTNGTRAISAKVKIENPLLRSGLALAGANLSKDTADNGILTALEASSLNLWGTKLVTLSACDTGVGEVKTGEGVYGLRRAFTLAGTETLVMSLWPVSDYVTREMMTTYYTGLKNGLGRGEALRQAELSMLKRKGREHPFYWASFIQSGEWGNLQGKR